MNHFLKIFIFLSIYAANAFGNDGFGELGIGGILLEKSTSIAMKSEVLDISYNKIKVDYEFINEGTDAVKTKISFPLPTYSAWPPESGVLYQGQPEEFEVYVNGQKIAYKTRVMAIHNGMDVTNILSSAGFSPTDIALMPFNIGPDNDYRVDEKIISKSQLDILNKNKLMRLQFPDWDISIVYEWDYIFKPNSIVKVQHSYKPFIAVGAVGNFTTKYGLNKDDEKYCIDTNLQKKLQEIEAEKSNISPFDSINGTKLEYILNTANSWKDSIREFTLLLRKEDPSEVISLCFPGDFRKIDSLTLESKIHNFVPKNNLQIIYINVKNKNMKTGSFGMQPKINQ